MKPTLDDLRDELDKGRITEADVRATECHLDGYCDHGSKRVYVNPRPAIVETLLHELIHRRWPMMAEARVDAEAKRLLGLMSAEEVATFYRRYRVLARTRKRPFTVED